MEDIHHRTKIKDSDPVQHVEASDFREPMNQFAENFLHTYRSYIRDYFIEEYTESPESFPLMEPVYWSVLFRNRSIENRLYKNQEDVTYSRIFQFDTVGESRDFHRLPDHIQRERIATLIDKADTPLLTFEVRYGMIADSITGDPDYVTKNPDDMPEMGTIRGREFAKQHSENYQKRKKERFNLYGLETLVPQVGSPSFEYELSESIASHRQGLYLAAAATGGIALENILRVIIKRRLGEKELPSKTYIRDSVSRLDKSSILPGRLKSRVLEKNGIRNSHSHTNEDRVRKETVESLFLVIKDLIPFAID